MTSCPKGRRTSPGWTTYPLMVLSPKTSRNDLCNYAFKMHNCKYQKQSFHLTNPFLKDCSQGSREKLTVFTPLESPSICATDGRNGEPQLLIWCGVKALPCTILGLGLPFLTGLTPQKFWLYFFSILIRFGLPG
jgi:hypothetical protein